MSTPLYTTKGFSLLEIQIACALGGLLALGAFQFFAHVARNASLTSSRTVAYQVMGEVQRMAKENFQKRFWGFQSTVRGAESFPLNSPGLFSKPVGLTSVFQCPDGTRPACENLKLTQLSTTNPDTYRTVEFETKCQANGTSSQPIAGCATAPMVTMIVKDLTTGRVSRKIDFLGENILGTSLCVRPCVLAAEAGPKNPALVDYHLEVAVIYGGQGGQGNIVESHFALFTGDATEGTQVLPRE